jgi:flagella basal body P-ring formation protein FlgA
VDLLHRSAWATAIHRLLARLVALALLAAPAIAWPDEGGGDQLAARVRQLARDSVTAIEPGVRIEIELGSLDPRLKLAPCALITPYLSPHTRLWGATRIGVRCAEGARWNVYLPVRVKVFARASTVTQTLPAGTVLEAAHLGQAEIDLAADWSPAVRRPADALGRALSRPLRAGQSLRQADLKPRQWFAAGDTVRILASGPGYTISSEGQAIVAGVEGQPAKVRIEGGRIVSGRPSGQRQIEVSL